MNGQMCYLLEYHTESAKGFCSVVSIHLQLRRIKYFKPIKWQLRLVNIVNVTSLQKNFKGEIGCIDSFRPCIRRFENNLNSSKVL